MAHILSSIKSKLNKARLTLLITLNLPSALIFSQTTITEKLKNAEIDNVKDGFIVYGMNEGKNSFQFEVIKYGVSLKKIKNFSKTFPKKIRWEEGKTNGIYSFTFISKNEKESISIFLDEALNEIQDPVRNNILNNQTSLADSIKWYKPEAPDWEKFNSAVVYSKLLSFTKNKAWYILVDTANQEYNTKLYCFDIISGNLFYKQQLNENNELFLYSYFLLDSSTEKIIIAGNYSNTEPENKTLKRKKDPLKIEQIKMNGIVYIDISIDGKISSKTKQSFPNYDSHVDFSFNKISDRFTIIHEMVKTSNSEYLIINEDICMKQVNGVAPASFGQTKTEFTSDMFWVSMGFNIIKMNNAFDVVSQKTFPDDSYSAGSYHNTKVTFSKTEFARNTNTFLLSDFIINHSTNQALLLYSVVTYPDNQKIYYAISIDKNNSIKHELKKGSKKNDIQYFIMDEKLLLEFSANILDESYTIEILPIN